MKTIVLVGDQAYQEQVSTTIKSILYYNKNVKIYVFNQGLSDEWFRDFNELAEQLDSELVNISLDQVMISPEWLTQDHINSAAYTRNPLASYLRALARASSWLLHRGFRLETAAALCHVCL